MKALNFLFCIVNKSVSKLDIIQPNYLNREEQIKKARGGVKSPALVFNYPTLNQHFNFSP